MKSLIDNPRLLVIALVATLTSQFVIAQATLTIGSATACPTQIVSVPLNATNLSSVGAITLYIGYDTAAVSYEGHINTHAQFPGLMSNATLTPVPQIIIAWNSLTPGNLPSGKLLDLQFKIKRNSSPLNFRPGGEIVASNLVNIPFTATNGFVGQLPPYITSHPQNTTVPAATNAIFTLVASDVDTYQWQQNNGLEWTNLQSTPTYQNVNGPQLTIVGTPFSLNNFKYRCQVTKTGACSMFSNPAVLTVIPGGSGLPQVYSLTGGGAFCAGTSPTGINITLQNSEAGVTYQLYNGPNAMGAPVTGNGAPIVWQNVGSGLYLANATNIYGTVNMNGTITVSQNPLPVMQCPGNMSVTSSSPAFPLSGAIPEGGTYSGPGVSAGSFNPGTAGAGNHLITYSYTNASNCSNTCTFLITVTSPYLPGDANGDGIVNILDAVIIANYIMGQSPNPFVFEAADVNGDGIINIQDFVLTINIIMGG